MADEYTKFCVDELTECLRSKCPEFKWSKEERISGKDLETWIDICGKSDEHMVLIQLEMHKVAALTNAVKMVYCLEGHPYKEKRVLMLHIFSPFSEKPEKTHEREDSVYPPQFLKNMERKETRESARAIAHNVRLLCQFLEGKGLLNSESITYKVVPWHPVDPAVRKATIVFPEHKSEFPKGTLEAMANLADQIKIAIGEWQRGSKP